MQLTHTHVLEMSVTAVKDTEQPDCMGNLFKDKTYT